MNIDEFIEHTQEEAKKHRYHADFFDIDNPMRVACINSAEYCEQLAEWLEKFKEYRHLEEQGRLIKLPCKFGDMLYWIADEDDYGHKEMCIKQYSESEKVTGFHLREDGEVLVFIGYFDIKPDMVGERYALLTRESAEAKLKELRGGENDRISKN